MNHLKALCSLRERSLVSMLVNCKKRRILQRLLKFEEKLYISGENAGADLVMSQTQARYLEVVHLRHLKRIPSVLCCSEFQNTAWLGFIAPASIVISLLLLHFTVVNQELPPPNCFARGQGLLSEEVPLEILIKIYVNWKAAWVQEKKIWFSLAKEI